MSTTTAHLGTLQAPVERRFYPRISPTAPIYITFGESSRESSGRHNVGLLVNIGENGLLVSTPMGLTRNFVYRVSLRLNGLPRAIHVPVRVVWTSESKRAGIQLLDLSEHDREQIRKWAASETGRETILETPLARRQANLPSSSAEPTRVPSLLPTRPPAVLTYASAASAVVDRAAWRAQTVVCLSFLGVAALASGLYIGNRAFHEAITRLTDTLTSQKYNETAETHSAKVRPAHGSDNEVAMHPTPKNPAAADKRPAAKIDWGALSNQPAHFPAEAPRNFENGSSLATSEHAGDDSGRRYADSPLPNQLPAAVSENSHLLGASPIPVPRRPGPVAVHMDVPQQRVVQLKPSSSQASLVNLPEDRVLKAPSVTMHIQRSILIPTGSRSRSSGASARVLIGELLVRIDPQSPSPQAPSAGSVSVRAIFDKNGRLANLKPVSGAIALVPSVMRAIRDWRYQPTLLDGKPVETEAFILVEFRALANRSM
jgi:hypothetical protein